MKRKTLNLILVVALVLIPTLLPAQVLAQDPGIEVLVIDGPPTPPPGYDPTPVEVVPATAVKLSDVPAFDWSYGCSATSGAMMAGYYDRTGYDDMYTGPNNGGVCPLNNGTWGLGECPLSATHQGIDSRGIKGHVDDYWVGYLDPGPDPFKASWTEHNYGDCTGDYMRTNQSNYGNSDGSTTFYYFINGAPIRCSDLEPGTQDDGGCGLRHFFESRGYTVLDEYNQLIADLGLTYGFTWEQYKAEIDAGRPVLIHIANPDEGHTMLAYGYDDDPGRTMYIHDTWNHDEWEMEWADWYAGMLHYMVTVVQLGDPPPEGDFGDLEGKPTFLAENGPRHATQHLWLGAAFDLEPDSRGYENDNLTDDGVTFLGSGPVGGPYTMPYKASDAEGAIEVLVSGDGAYPNVVYVSAWFDQNHDCDFDDALENIVMDAAVGCPGPYLFTFPMAPGMPTGDAPFRVRVGPTPLDPVGYLDYAYDGEVEDHLLVHGQLGEFDWGDAPDPLYCTLAASAPPGASHLIVPGAPFLGIGDLTDDPDAEPDGQPHPNAMGDDNAGTDPDDEDGVSIPALVPGQPAVITFEVHNGPASVDGWIDFNGSGVWGDMGGQEYVVTGVYATGVHSPAIPVPPGAVPGPTFARFRINSLGPLPPCGPADDGEVEDYLVEIEPVPPGKITICKDADPADGTKFWFDGPLGPFKLQDGNCKDFDPLDPDDYDVTESVPTGWKLVKIECTNGDWTPLDSNGLTIHLDPDEDIICTFYDEELVEELDFGDAPDSYGTLLFSNGARHILSPLWMGPLIDPEPDGQPVPPGLGDDLNGLADEDGVTFATPLVPGGPPAQVIVDGGPMGGMLDAWIDFNGNGAFDHPGEHLWGGSLPLAPGPGNTPPPFLVPPGAVPGPTYARFRLSALGVLLPTGLAPDGEVEDYGVEIESPPPGQITIVKEAIPEDDTPFEFSGDLGGFILMDPSDNSETFPGLTAGDYHVTENVPAGWNLLPVFCTGGDFDLLATGVTIHLDAGENIECTFTNEALPGSITIVKEADPEDDTPFEFSGDMGPFTLMDPSHVFEMFSPLPPDDYEVTEILPTDWELDYVQCVGADYWDSSGTSVTIHLRWGEDVVCTFHNKEEPTAIDLLSFSAEAGAEGVALAWETATELDNAGFNLYRALLDGGPYSKVNGALISAKGDAVSGASYSFVDTADYGTYYYKLEDVDLYGVSTMHGPVRVTVARPARRPLYRPTPPPF
jgi:hypothetical protein